MLVLAYRPESGERRVRASRSRRMPLGRLAVQRAVAWPARGPPESSRPRTDPCSVRPPSPADSELLDDPAIPLGVLPAQVLEETAPFTDQHQQPPARVMVLRVQLEVLREAIDALGQERDLHLRGASVTIMDPELLDKVTLLFDRQRHGMPPSIASPRGAHAPPERVQKRLFYQQLPACYHRTLAE